MDNEKNMYRCVSKKELLQEYMNICSEEVERLEKENDVVYLSIILLALKRVKETLSKEELEEILMITGKEDITEVLSMIKKRSTRFVETNPRMFSYILFHYDDKGESVITRGGNCLAISPIEVARQQARFMQTNDEIAVAITNLDIAFFDYETLHGERNEKF